MLANGSLPLDFGVLMAVERITTGANAHHLRGLANVYVLACENNEPIRAEEYRRRLLRELVRGKTGKADASSHGLSRGGFLTRVDRAA